MDLPKVYGLASSVLADARLGADMVSILYLNPFTIVKSGWKANLNYFNATKHLSKRAFGIIFVYFNIQNH
jgi:hypothetical protein